MIEMKVSGIVLDPQSRNPIVVLRDLPERRALMIWIGPPEANSIMLAIENVELARPATHDLFSNSLKALGVEMESMLINRMEDNTFYAQLQLRAPQGKRLQIDSRPSDAIALSLRNNASILVSEEVMASSSISINPAREEKEAKDFKSFIQGIKPSDFNQITQKDASDSGDN